MPSAVKDPCPGSGRELLQLEARVYGCPICNKVWPEEAIGATTPDHPAHWEPVRVRGPG